MGITPSPSIARKASSRGGYSLLSEATKASNCSRSQYLACSMAAVLPQARTRGFEHLFCSMYPARADADRMCGVEHISKHEAGVLKARIDFTVGEDNDDGRRTVKWVAFPSHNCGVCLRYLADVLFVRKRNDKGTLTVHSRRCKRSCLKYCVKLLLLYLLFLLAFYASSFLENFDSHNFLRCLITVF